MFPEFNLNMDLNLEDDELSAEVLDFDDEAIEQMDDVALFVQSRRGKTILQYNGHRYRKAYKTRNGTRWNCSQNKNCSAFLFLNDSDEILMSYVKHRHPPPSRLENVDTDQNGKFILDMISALLFIQHGNFDMHCGQRISNIIYFFLFHRYSCGHYISQRKRDATFP